MSKRIKYIKYWLVTLARHQVKDYVDYQHLKSIIKFLSSPWFKIKDYCLERHGKYKQLHAHMIVTTTSSFRYKSYVRSVSGYIMHFQLVNKSLSNTVSYIHKHCNHHSKEQLHQTNYCNYYAHHYGFKKGKQE